MGRNGRDVAAASVSSIEITFQYQGERCRERLPLKPTAANLKQAEQHRAAILHAISCGVFDYAATFPNSQRATRFAESPAQVNNAEKYLEDWLDAKKPTLKSSTHAGYYSIVHGTLIPEFGKLALSELNRPRLKAWLARLGGGTRMLSNKRMTNIQSCLRSALTDAVEDEVLDANPMAGFHYRANEAPSSDDDVDPFTPEEQAAILAQLPAQTRNYFRFALWTGLRPSE